MKMNYSNKKISYFILCCIILLNTCGCANVSLDDIPLPDISTLTASDEQIDSDTSSSAEESNTQAEESALPLRDSTAKCLVASSPGIDTVENDVAVIDFSNSSEGYVSSIYTGNCSKVKLRVVGSDEIVYTYDLNHNVYEYFPLTSGSGSYEVTIYENVSDSDYSTCLHAQFDVHITDEFKPFLYASQYVNFTKDSQTVSKGEELATGAHTDLEVITNIYNYITSNIKYDYNKASDPPSGYISDVDQILNSKTGICLDYAAVMTAMLRSQQIPTKLEVGYAQDAYHAWISVYTKEAGWLNNVIEFDGKIWTLVDPTFGANSDDRALKKFIGDGNNYLLQKVY